jgi:hypothetical protein
MLRQTLSHYPFAIYNALATLLFFSVFIGAVIFVVKKKNQNYFKFCSELPLESSNKKNEGEKNE